MHSSWRAALVALAVLANGVMSADILETTGFGMCGTGQSTVSVQRINIQYNNDNKTVTFDVAGSSSKAQNVSASLKVTAYGQEVYANSFNPCDRNTFVQQLCPVPAGTFAARGTQQIPEQFANLVPAIAFQVPDISAVATLELTSLDTNQSVACIQSQVSNGKTANVPAVSYVAASVAGAALAVTGASALSAAFAGGGAAVGGGVGGGAGTTGGGAGTLSPSFTEVFGWMQGMAMNGMLSVNYPPVYRSFARNFAFSTGLIPWTKMQEAIDDFRGRTGGDLAADSVETLRKTTLVFPDGTRVNGSSSLFKRAVEGLADLAARQIETSIDLGAPAAAANQTAGDDKFEQAVSGIQGYVQQLSVPQSNTFMTVLLVVAIVIAAIVVSILLVKVVLEAWAVFGNFPKPLAGFRKHYWGSIARAITSLILLLYGVWVLYCIFQFTHGDSWAAKALAGATLGLFTGILAFFSFKIWSTARKLKKQEGDAAGLYYEKDIWVKYSLFYESYKKDYWWIFIPTIAYMFIKGAAIALGDGHGMAQTVAQLAIEGVMLVFLLWSRPFERRSGNIINIVIQVVRVLSVACILVFVEQFGIAQTTQTVTGVVLIAVQSTLTGILAILIIWNAINQCCKKNPHRQRRKDLEKMRDADNLTPLDARNSLLMDRPKTFESSTTFSMASATLNEKQELQRQQQQQQQQTVAAARSAPANGYLGGGTHERNGSSGSSRSVGRANYSRPITPLTPMRSDRDSLVQGAAPLGQADMRRPTLPNVGEAYDGGYSQAPTTSSGYLGNYGAGYGYGYGVSRGY